MPPLWLLPILQRIMKEEEEAFWRGLDVEMGEELELGPPPLNIQPEEAGWWAPWGLELDPTQEGLPLSPIGPWPIMVDSTKQAPEDGAMVEEDTIREQV